MYIKGMCVAYASAALLKGLKIEKVVVLWSNYSKVKWYIAVFMGSYCAQVNGQFIY